MRSRIRAIPTSPTAPPIAGDTWAQARATPLDNRDRSRAQSLMAGIRYRDGSTNPDTLTLAQARDVLAWYSPKEPQQ